MLDKSVFRASTIRYNIKDHEEMKSMNKLNKKIKKYKTEIFQR